MPFVELLPWLWLSTIILGIGLLELLWYGVVVLRAMDLSYDSERCAERRPKVNLRKALVRRVSWPELGVPLYLICVALFAVQLGRLNLATYTVISIIWFGTAPLRMMWGLAVARRAAIRKGRLLAGGYWSDLRGYYRTGFRMPELPDDRVWFVGRLRWLNRFQKLGHVVQLYRFWGVVGAAAAALFWPITCVCAVFYHMDNARLTRYRHPWWRLDRTTATAR